MSASDSSTSQPLIAAHPAGFCMWQVHAKCLALCLILAFSGAGVACPLSPEFHHLPLGKAPKAKYSYFTEACCVSGGGSISYQYRTPIFYSPHSFIGDGPGTCRKDKLPTPCPGCTSGHGCGYKRGELVFIGDAWQKAVADPPAQPSLLPSLHGTFAS